MNLAEIIDAFINGYKYKQLYSRCSENYSNCTKSLEGVSKKLIDAEATIKHLEKLVPRPHPPKLSYLVEKDTTWIQGVLAEFKADIIRLPLGQEFQLTDKTSFMEFVAWDWVDSFEYYKFYRCGNFAISFKAHADQFGINQVGVVLDYQAGHAYNIVVFPSKRVMLLEPQNDQIWYWEDKDLPFYVLEGAVVII